MARVLVLGGTSYVAQFLLQRLLQDKTLQVAGDNKNAIEEISAVACTIRCPPFAPLPDGFVTAESELAAETKARIVRVYWEVDIVDLEALRACVTHFRPTIVVNCTAISSAAICQKNPDKTRSINEPRSLVGLLETMPWRIRLVHFSTDFVYDGLQQRGESYEENAAVLSPLLSEYGASKVRFDQYLIEKKTAANLQVVILRIANVVGPPAPLLPDHSAPKFMQWLHHQLATSDSTGEEQQTPLALWYDEYRSYLYIHDLVIVMFKLLGIKFTTGTSLFNVGTSG
ncbi:hypothetical protein BBO99_00001307 [Phytophthora kernoviae]|uniref:NAD-dependent epimerase/dehydratase domain-containing protein n=2 Tax=Phytophthora kernoviae TaxID=325452 RepID=A0A421FFX9_9STRA|nr:hypothetical protein G195_004749 [Phytophthora kernoviae 00238/432]KAG2531529.1 hypothetical protein JM16_001010 [Phytophthora kernoviae]KAG2532468.1 hypothetical protein JM18_001092 [Phytophthora kernoviae]RLN44266.1 hypothetical protein BBI17_001082 [Phytophthora kernoviae]RLN84455.1 hypothetical protein BBO99_00001307 [Phytophthora kernoviae]